MCRFPALNFCLTKCLHGHALTLLLWSRKLQSEKHMQRRLQGSTGAQNQKTVQQRSDSLTFCELITAWLSDLNARVRLLVGSAVKHRPAV